MKTVKFQNPLKVSQSFELTMPVINAVGERIGEKATLFTVEPGAEVEILAIYERAIHIVHNGVVMGGLAPLLRRVEPPQDYRVHIALLPSDNDGIRMSVTADDVAARMFKQTENGPAADPMMAAARARKGTK
jgi:hypothetical protein